MIIEAGYDLLQIVYPHLEDRKKRDALWVITMDKNLRHLFIRKVTADASTQIELLIPAIAKSLQRKNTSLKVRYFALAHRHPDVHHTNIEQWTYDEDRPIIDAPELSEYRYLGRYVTDGEWSYSSWPRYSFCDYIGCEDLPQAAVIPGPHEMFKCECLACSTRVVALEQSRAAHLAAVESHP